MIKAGAALSVGVLITLILNFAISTGTSIHYASGHSRINSYEIQLTKYGLPLTTRQVQGGGDLVDLPPTVHHYSHLIINLIFWSALAGGAIVVVDKKRRYRSLTPISKGN